jgi:hypothetical protein
MDSQHVTAIDFTKRGGQPCVRGLSDLTSEDTRASLACAADRERKLVIARSK